MPREFTQRSAACVWTEIVLVRWQRAQESDGALGFVLPLSRKLLKFGSHMVGSLATPSVFTSVLLSRLRFDGCNPVHRYDNHREWRAGVV